ncbi:hypothetical protein K7X08_000975 [Anisodus acutangulus]|uniref:Uncharacterized protein n=1 Tax=Anisodus acutangulus TaxID=402998 RepID=A0A9Q1RK59_9SOLA|nr:hypothetical protein K7X08_000975 [Anisodus acutangulus]
MYQVFKQLADIVKPMVHNEVQQVRELEANRLHSGEGSASSAIPLMNGGDQWRLAELAVDNPGYEPARLSGDAVYSETPFQQSQPVPNPYHTGSANFLRMADVRGEQTWNTIPPYSQVSSVVPGAQVAGFGGYAQQQQWGYTPPVGNGQKITYNFQNHVQQGAEWRPPVQNAY